MSERQIKIKLHRESYNAGYAVLDADGKMRALLPTHAAARDSI